MAFLCNTRAVTADDASKLLLLPFSLTTSAAIFGSLLAAKAALLHLRCVCPHHPLADSCLLRNALFALQLQFATSFTAATDVFCHLPSSADSRRPPLLTARVCMWRTGLLIRWLQHSAGLSSQLNHTPLYRGVNAATSRFLR